MDDIENNIFSSELFNEMSLENNKKLEQFRKERSAYRSKITGFNKVIDDNINKYSIEELETQIKNVKEIYSATKNLDDAILPLVKGDNPSLEDQEKSKAFSYAFKCQSILTKLFNRKQELTDKSLNANASKNNDKGALPKISIQGSISSDTYFMGSNFQNSVTSGLNQFPSHDYNLRYAASSMPSAVNSFPSFNTDTRTNPNNFQMPTTFANFDMQFGIPNTLGNNIHTSMPNYVPSSSFTLPSTTSSTFTLPNAGANMGNLNSAFQMPQMNSYFPPMNPCSIQMPKLPPIELPIFDGEENNSFNKFLFRLEAVRREGNIPPSYMFLLLRSKLQGKPLKLIDKLDYSRQTYAHAVDYLSKAFATPQHEQHNTIKSMLDLNWEDPFSFMGEIHHLRSSLRDLKISSETILNYLVWNCMPTSIRNSLIVLTNCSRPSLDLIEKFLFEANEQSTEQRAHWLKEKNKKADKKETTAGATNVQFDKNKASKGKKVENDNKPKKNKHGRKPHCSLCHKDNKNSEHFLSQCTIYSNVQMRKKQLESVSGCTKCGYTSHPSTQCKVNFAKRPCHFCKGQHIGALCSANTVDNKKPGSNDKIDAGVVVINVGEVFSKNTRDNSTLPSATLEVGSSKRTCHSMIDSGAQKSLIKESIANEQQLEVINNDISISIRGINGHQDYLSKQVKVPIHINNSVEYIYAYTIPEIPLTINCEALKPIIAKYLELGFEIADKNLLPDCQNSKDGFDLLLSGRDFRILDIQFHYEKEATLLSSNIGHMFLGDLNDLEKNVEFLLGVDVCESVSEDESLQDDSQSVDEKSEDDFMSIVLCESSSESDNANKHVNIASTDIEIVADNDIDSYNATELKTTCQKVLNLDSEITNSNSKIETDVNIQLAQYTLDNTQRDSSGRLIMPLMWHNQIKHRLAQNFHLAKNILDSSFKKLEKVENGFDLINSVFKEQAELGIIEKIENVENFMLKNPTCAFLPHKPVYKFDRSTTKVRVVLMPNLKEKMTDGIQNFSNNQCILAGPNLNHKIVTAVTLLRFDKFLLNFDIQKAFLNIELLEEDQDKVMFLWYNSADKNELVAYRSKRLPFGLKCSPSILTLGLFRMLILDAQNDGEELQEFKRKLFSLMYVDNGAYTTNDKNEIQVAKQKSTEIFGAYKFNLQQFTTNAPDVQEQFDKELNENTPVDIKVLGIQWDRENDQIGPKPISLDSNACTRRQILKTVNSVYDILGIYLPIMNRAKLFLQKLARNAELGWDTPLNDDLQKEWQSITKYVTKTKQVAIPRMIGERQSSYRLVCFTDASRLAYGMVIYAIDTATHQISFITSKNRLLNCKLCKKTIPELEVKGVAFGVEQLLELKQELSGAKVMIPINIESLELFTDSMITIDRIKALLYNFEKLKEPSVFVKNCLKTINDACLSHPITFSFVEGAKNPSDLVTRLPTHNKFNDSDFHLGPGWVSSVDHTANTVSVTLPHPLTGGIQEFDAFPVVDSCNDGMDGIASESEDDNGLVAVNNSIHSVAGIPEALGLSSVNFSSFNRFARIYRTMFRGLNNWKQKVKNRNPNLFSNAKLYPFGTNFYAIAVNHVIKIDQKLHFPELVEYFLHDPEKVPKKNVPDMVTGMNLFLSPSDGLIRVKSKMAKKFKNENEFPVLLSKVSYLADIIISDIHIRMDHSGVYSVLNELRSQFWILHYFTKVKKVLKNCIDCRRYNSNVIQLNQNSYRDFRIDPPQEPFKYLFLDYLGHYWVYNNGRKQKVWLLLFSCLWSRCINLKVCLKADVHTFLQAFQSHVYDYGLPELCLSDLGSTIVAGSKIIKNFLEEHETHNYFEEKGIKILDFETYSKGNSSLGSLVESAVKIIRLHLNKVIKTIVLDLEDFRLFIQEAQHMSNKRPLVSKAALRDNLESGITSVITPELLVKGYHLNTLNVIPQLHVLPDEWRLDQIDLNISKSLEKLQKARQSFRDEYEKEFLLELADQATNQRNRYQKVKHRPLKVGDIVLLKEPFAKALHYPMGIVRSVKINSLNEVTSAIVFKGSTRELADRHVNSLVLLVPVEESDNDDNVVDINQNEDKINCTNNGPINTQNNHNIANNSNSINDRPRRKAADKCRQILQELISDDAL